MASLGHVAVGLCAGRLFWDRAPRRRWLVPAMLVLAALALLPDLDVIAFRLKIPYAAPFGHRGASHSLAAAAVAGLLLGVMLRPLQMSVLRLCALCAAVVASHGLLDTLTDGGLGVALLWPWSTERFFAPLRPIPVAPIGRRLLSARGLSVMAREVLWFLPLWLYALWPRRARTA